ncbi:alpha/beta hydrolase [Gangjinia marincola]|uniref:Alpha/beta hydrolase n=1 Tax=Gangjinia marincola TaxID=578463 RepID=A0ABP3XRF3_9FLAO
MGGNKKLTQVYMMPGMAANPSIFEHINLPKDEFDIHWLNWIIPKKNESLLGYAKRICEDIPKEPCVLIGVSFGGVLVQEMAKYLEVSRLIIISSVKHKEELPLKMKLARKTGVYKMIPTSLAGYLGELERFPVPPAAKKRARLYKQYLSVSNKHYLDWAIQEIICWDQAEAPQDIIHIHGDKDPVFPVKYINDAIVIPEGTHIMIINRYKWFNKHLPSLIRTGFCAE